MAGEPVGTDVIEERETTADVSRLRGRVFEWISAAATVFGITVVAGLLLYVANDALRPLSADLGWHLTFAVTLGLPTVVTAAYYLTRDRAAGRVAYETVGVLTVGVILAGGLVILFHELATPVEWLALVVALIVGGSSVVVHARLRPEAALERLFVSVLAPILAVFGVPAVSVQHTVTLPLSGTELGVVSFALPQLLPSVRDLVRVVPVLPVDWMLLVLTVTTPMSFAFGRFVASRRSDGRGRNELVVGGVLVASIAALVAPLAGVSSENGVLLTTAVIVPSGAYLEGVVRRSEGILGLLFPVVMVGGGLTGMAITGMLDLAGPDTWLDWGFLTSATSRTPADAGIYPALVGSVMIVLVIALTAFPVGVGAAIYLEEYAPSSGWLARLVELIEINIGNLAGVPSIVYGLLGLALFVQGIGLRSGIVIVGGLTVGLLILPIVIISAQEALRAVPDSRRQASYGMGATRWQTTRNVVLPEALPGILTGTILALGRAIGETAPLLMIGIASSVRSPPDGFFSKTGAMPRQIFSWSSEIEPEFRFGVLAAGVIVLVVVLLVMNGTAIVLRNRNQRSHR
jgi:phosphate transport system permease protein